MAKKKAPQPGRRNPIRPVPPNPRPHPVPQPSPAKVSPLTQIHAQPLVDLLNQQRAANGVSGNLTLSDSMSQLSQGWANQMAAEQNMYHGDFQGRFTHAFPNISGAENIAYGYATMQLVVTGWMNSPPHRADILGNYNTIGVGFALGANNLIYWCTDFGLEP